MRAGQGHSRKFPPKKKPKNLSVFMKNIHSKAIQGLNTAREKTPMKTTHLGTNTTSKGSAQVTPKEMGTRSSLEGCKSRKLKCRKRIHLRNTGPGHKHSVDLHTLRLSELSTNPRAMWVLSEGVMGAELSPWSPSFLPSSGSVWSDWGRERGLAAHATLAAISSEGVEFWNGWGWKET